MVQPSLVRFASPSRRVPSLSSMTLATQFDAIARIRIVENNRMALPGQLDNCTPKKVALPDAICPLRGDNASRIVARRQYDSRGNQLAQRSRAFAPFGRCAQLRCAGT